MTSISQRLVGVMMAGVISCGVLPAEQSRGTPEPRRIGYVTLRPLNESDAAMVPITALKDGLRDLGYVEGKDYVLEVRTANNDPTSYPELAAELTKLQVKRHLRPWQSTRRIQPCRSSCEARISSAQD